MDSKFLDRLEEARSLLGINGLLSESENRKVKERILKKCLKAGLQVREVPGWQKFTDTKGVG